MKLRKNIVRKKLLKVPLADWKTSGVDVRSVHFGPGQITGVHSHPCPVLGYIAQGTALLQIAGQPAQRLRPGAAFYEPAGVEIQRFDNASDKQPLHFIAMYLLHGKHPLIEMRE